MTTGRKERGANLHLFPSVLVDDSRLFKITSSLAEAGVFDRIVMIGVSKAGLPEREELDPKRKIIRVKREIGRGRGTTFWKAAQTLEWWVRALPAAMEGDVECINCHSLPTLPLCVLLKFVTGSRLVYDTHECETETDVSRGVRRVLAKITERALIGFADETCVVNDSIADWYRERYGLPNVHVVRNVPHRSNTQVVANDVLRRTLGVPDSDLIYLHLGRIAAGRNVDTLLEAFRSCSPNRHLVFVGDGPLSELVNTYASQARNIHRLDPVPPSEVESLAAGADVGLSLLENTCLNHYLSLGNKVFHCLSAGLAMLVSDFPEAARIIDETQCGWKVDPTPAAIRAIVERMTPAEVAAKKKNAAAARRKYAWEFEEPALLEIYRNLGLLEGDEEDVLVASAT